MNPCRKHVPRTQKTAIGPSQLRLRIRENLKIKPIEKNINAFWPVKRKVINIDKDESPSKKLWVYVFQITSWGVKLLWETQLGETDDEYNIVNWKKKGWKDKNNRTPSYKKEHLTIPCIFDARHSQGIYAMLSRIQLPWKRIVEYTGDNKTNPKCSERVRRRCTRFIPIPITEKNGRKNVYRIPRDKHWYLLIKEPITIADKVKNLQLKALEKYRSFSERNNRMTEYQYAKAALSVFRLSKIKDNKDGDNGRFKFNSREPKKVVDYFEYRSKSLRQNFDIWSYELRMNLESSEYNEAIRDHDYIKEYADECIRIHSRHVIANLQSDVTRSHMIEQLKDPTSFICKYFSESHLFQIKRKFTTMVSEFADILGEYGPILSKKEKYIKGWHLERIVKFRTEIDILPFRAIKGKRKKVLSYYAHDLVPDYDFRIYTKRLAQDPKFLNKAARHANKLLMVFEVINFSSDLALFKKAEKERKITDYAGAIGSLMDLTGSIGKWATAAYELKARQQIVKSVHIDELKDKLAPGKKILYKKGGFTIHQPTFAGKPSQAFRLYAGRMILGVVGIVSGVCDLWMSYDASEKALRSRKYEQRRGYQLTMVGYGLGLCFELVSLLGFSIPGVGWVAVALVVIGLIIVAYFSQSPVETWLRTSRWGDRGKKRDSIPWKMEKLNLILTAFRFDAEYDKNKKEMKITIVPGFCPVKSYFSIDIIYTDHNKVSYTMNNNKLIPKYDQNGLPTRFPVATIPYNLEKAFYLRGRTIYYHDIKVTARLFLHGKKAEPIPRKDKASFNFHYDRHAQKVMSSVKFSID